MAKNTPHTGLISYFLERFRPAFLVAAAAALALCVAPALALADEGDGSGSSGSASSEVRDNTDLNVKISEKYQEEIDRTTAEYKDAVEKAKEAKAALDENRDKISDLEEKLPVQAERSKDATCAQYKLEQQTPGVVDMLLNSEDFDNFMANLEYVTRASDANVAEMNRLAEMRDELEETQKELKEAKHEADELEDQAKEALEAAKQARVEAQKRAQEKARKEAEEARKRVEEAKAKAEEVKKLAEEAAQEQEEAAAKAKERAEAGKASSEEEVIDLAEGEGEDAESAASEEGSGESAEQSGETDSEDESSGDASSGTPSLSDDEDVSYDSLPTKTLKDDGADWAAGEAAFVEEWGARIDNYLAGSPLAGKGETFASAAWTYGVDPRWSPAIAATESSKGAVCFMSHNAWGWGSSSWDSWDEAINDHVKGLAHGYGYTATYSAAQVYCPPDWVFWYDTTVSEMNTI